MAVVTLTTDGEKPDRNRDTEFEAPPSTRAELDGDLGIPAGDASLPRSKR